jgi:hypothetical protein
MTANPVGDPSRSRDVARLRELTGPHLPYAGAPLQQALVRMTADDRAEAISILGRLGDPEGLRSVNKLRQTGLHLAQRLAGPCLRRHLHPRRTRG